MSASRRKSHRPRLHPWLESSRARRIRRRTEARSRADPEGISCIRPDRSIVGWGRPVRGLDGRAWESAPVDSAPQVAKLRAAS